MGSGTVALRAVFDTNIIISALVFQAGRLSWLRFAWHEGEIRPVVNEETVNELLRVLGHAKFSLDRDDIEELLADYLPFAEVWSGPVPPPGIEVRDPDDLMFVELALAAGVKLLVSGDTHLLSLTDELNLEVLSADALRRSLGRP